MTGLKMLGCLTFLAIIATLNFTDGQLMSQTTSTQMRLGTKDFQSVLDNGAVLLENLKPMAGALGIFGAFLTITLLFVPKQESAEMKFMKKEFAEINRKLDGISSKVENFEALVDYETQRAQYIHSANKIMFGYDQLHKFLNETSALKCVKEPSCRKESLEIAERYVESFNIKDNLYEIMKGTSGPGTVFGKSLLELIKKNKKCDINKVFDFANGVIKLAYYGQSVVLAYEKLTGTKQSISTTIKNWSEMAYNIRKKADDIKLLCYRNIDNYMKADIIDTKYQTGYLGNKGAAVALKNDLDKKYPWVIWTVLSYGASGSENHYGIDQFKSMPKKGSKRVLRAIASDNGAYSNLIQIISWMKRTIDETITYDDADNAESLFDKIVREIGTATKKKLLSLVVLRKYHDFQFAADRRFIELNEQFFLSHIYSKRFRIQRWHNFRVWAMSKSDEQIAGLHCDKSCVTPSTCELIPYTSRYYCLCSNFFYGEHCENFDTVSLAANIDQMLTLTSQIPTVSDVYFKVEDLQTYIGSSLNNVENTIAQLNTMLQEKFDNLDETLMTDFQWTNLLTEYSASMDSLTYYITRFKTLNSSDQTYETQSKALANLVVEPNGIQKWLYDLNLMIVGRMNILNENKPLIFILMEKNKNKVCNTNYKEALDAAWRQLVLLQSQAYNIWATSLAILHQSSDEIASEYQQKLLSQTDFMGNATCEITILNSANVNCSGGYYMYPGMTIINQCDENYYLVGNSTITCNKPSSSSCHACDCNLQECDDETGKCDCSNKFYGDKCNNRDCVWSSWSPFVVCIANDPRFRFVTDCYEDDRRLPGSRSRTRTKVQKHGEGQECIGKSVQTEECAIYCTDEGLIYL